MLSMERPDTRLARNGYWESRWDSKRCLGFLDDFSCVCVLTTPCGSFHVKKLVFSYKRTVRCSKNCFSSHELCRKVLQEWSATMQATRVLTQDWVVKTNASSWSCRWCDLVFDAGRLSHTELCDWDSRRHEARSSSLGLWHHHTGKGKGFGCCLQGRQCTSVKESHQYVKQRLAIKHWMKEAHLVSLGCTPSFSSFHRWPEISAY